ncbi:MAG: hypothetical protein EA376_02290 [Phycisphaeraceae bacterium]|nr:MAG: hypothetical protein EA376_02290 [Phycisphaeraceae bacterium]
MGYFRFAGYSERHLCIGDIHAFYVQIGEACVRAQCGARFEWPTASMMLGSLGHDDLAGREPHFRDLNTSPVAIWVIASGAVIRIPER